MVERSLDHQMPMPPPPPTRTAHIHGVNSRKPLSCGPAIIPPRVDSMNYNDINIQGRSTNGDIDGNSSSSSPPTDSISQRATPIVAATATMPRGLNGPSMNGNGNGRKKKSVTIGTFTTVETFDPGYTSAAV